MPVKEYDECGNLIPECELSDSESEIDDDSETESDLVGPVGPVSETENDLVGPVGPVGDTKLSHASPFCSLRALVRWRHTFRAGKWRA